jgi:cell wall-associated NlpC family hydrolase
VTFRFRTLIPVVAAALVAVAAPVQAQRSEMSLESKKPFAAFSASAQALRDSIVAKARGQVGTRYKLGGTKPNIALDCSGLVKYALSVLDVVLPRTAQSQSKVGAEVPRDLAALKPGDVLTFGRGKRVSHVGIYVGDGKMVHASTSKRQVIETSLTTRSPLIKQWKGVRRFVDGNTKAFKDSVLAFADTLR